MASEHYVKPSLQVVNGLSLPKYGVNPNLFRSSLNFSPKSCDVIVATYPTSGTAFVQNLIWNIVNNGAALPSEMKELNSTYFPLLELTEPSQLVSTDSKSFRLLKTHTPVSHSPFSEDSGKFIYVARNPKDCLISYYYLHLELPQIFAFRGSFDDFFRSFLNGQIAWGDYFDHVYSWFQLKQKENVLFMTYEKMRMDPTGAILKIAHFLGLDSHHKLNKDDRKTLSNVVALMTHKSSAFHSLSRRSLEKPPLERDAIIRYNDQADFGRFVFGRDDSKENGVLPVLSHRQNLFRIGLWRNYLSEEQNQQIDDRIVQKLGGTFLCDLWKSRTTH